MNTNKQIQELSASLSDYLQREMPAGTVIGDPAWWADRIARAILAARQPAPESSQQGSGAVPDYRDMSREALERHAARMAQALANDKARKFYDKHATGPMMPPSCICCGQLPDKVAIRHAELPGIVICEKCAAHPPADAAPVDAKPSLQNDPSHEWPVFDRILIDAYKAGADCTDLDLIACRRAMLAAQPCPAQGDAEQIARVIMHMSGRGLINWRGTGNDEDDAWSEDEEYGATLGAVRKALEESAQGDAVGQQAGDIWRSVDSGLPEVETDVLVRGKRGDSVCHEVAGLFCGVWQGQGSEEPLRFEVTHWMPLPPLSANVAQRATSQPDSERDAARYRELRDYGLFVVASSGIGWSLRRDEPPSTAAEMDAAMDEHMRMNGRAAQTKESSNG